MIEIDQATTFDFVSFVSQKMPAYVLRSGGEPVAMAGFFDRDGEVWTFLDVRGRLTRAESITLIRRMKAVIAAMDQPLIVSCDAEGHPDAPRLLRFLGFEPTDRTINGLGVWKYG